MRERPQPILYFLRTCFISSKDLAKAVGYSQTYVSHANRGLIRTSPAYRQRCADFLEISPEVLFDAQALAETTARSGKEDEPLIGGCHFTGYGDEA
jgi:predicted transcriptional regulator